MGGAILRKRAGISGSGGDCSLFSSQGGGGRGCAAVVSEVSRSILVAAATPAPAAAMTEQMTLRGTLKGHNGWVTQIATTPQFPDMILSASRGTS